MQRFSVLVYGLLSYLMFFGVFLYSIGFLGNMVVPTRLDGAATTSLPLAILVDAALLLLFSIQHSTMARPWFKSWLTRFIPQAAERSTYVLFSNFAMIALFAFWQPLGISIWKFDNPVVSSGIYLAFFLGWGLIFVSTCLISHFDLFGLRQVWLYFQGRPYQALKFNTPWLYKHVRHPLYVGWLMAIWATPTMGAGHLLFSIGTTIYILVAIRLEESDLIGVHGVAYRAYQNRVPMLVPRLYRKSSLQTSPAE